MTYFSKFFLSSFRKRRRAASLALRLLRLIQDAEEKARLCYSDKMDDLVSKMSNSAGDEGSTANTHLSFKSVQDEYDMLEDQLYECECNLESLDSVIDELENIC